jgi:hypothetical protein
MIVIISGEGPTDFGSGDNGLHMAEGKDHLPGPMAMIVDHLLMLKTGSSILENGKCIWVSKSYLALQSKRKIPISRKCMSLSGKHRAKETKYFYDNARALARIAMQIEKERRVATVAVLFRDCDGVSSAGRGLWREKRQSMVNGFFDEGYKFGVAMLPKPKSEAWLICATKSNPYSGCAKLEDRSGNDRSENNLKEELRKILGYECTRINLAELIQSKRVDCTRINMPSYKAFSDDLYGAIP